ncbi:pentatricopeptide repeat-containing protein At3g12770-like [Aristolochia californica]|uniref:pentatricopeptide repeat-containing protein At3g12770-like n=1 Tax=Aristolochia californica TaxID=171875 RepID=UPI0035DE9449
MKCKYRELSSEFTYPYRNQGGFRRDRIDTPIQFIKSIEKVFERMADRSIVSGNSQFTIFMMKWHEKFHEVKSTNLFLPGASTIGLGFEYDAFVSNALIHMYAKLGWAGEAWHGRDLVTWNSMFTAYEQHDDPITAQEFFCGVTESGLQPDVSSIAFQRGDTHFVFDSMNRKVLQAGHALHERYCKLGEQALVYSLINLLVDLDVFTAAYKPVINIQSILAQFTVVGFLTACPNLGFLKTWSCWCARNWIYIHKINQGRNQYYHSCGVQKDMQSDPRAAVYAQKSEGTLEELGQTTVIMNVWISKITVVSQSETAQSLVCRVYDVATQFHDMPVKALKVDDTRRVFDQITQRNLICWNAMILGHCIHGKYCWLVMVLPKWTR